MKMIFYYITLSLFVISCGAKKNYTNGNYDLAIQQMVKKLRKKPDHFKTLNLLEDAFNIAKVRDLDRINILKQEGTPENWDQIFNIYSKIKTRQNLVKTLTNIPSGISFTNVNEDLVQAKKNAAEYNYQKGIQLLNNNNRFDARKAADEFEAVKRYFNTYKDVDQKINEANSKGISYVLFNMTNETNLIMPKGFEDEILKVSLTDINEKWTRFHTNKQSNINYDYQINFRMMNILVSPEQMREKKYTDVDTIEDGWDYVLDKNGNVEKDTAGNDIKVKKYAEIKCDIIETQQLKTTQVNGSLEFYDANNQLLKNAPLVSETVFEHFSAKAIGNLNALKKESKKKIRNRPVPFPSNPEMIFRSSEQIKNMIKDIVYAQRNMLI